MENTTKFKAMRPISVTHERGTEILSNVQGEVQKIEGNRVHIKGQFYDFSISLKDYINFNAFNMRMICG